jgi:hypothetical protein
VGCDWPTALDFSFVLYSVTSVYSNTGRGIDIILSLNIQQECIHSLIVVEKYISGMYFRQHLITKLFSLRSDPDVCENDNQWMTNRGSMVDVAKFINFLLVFCDKKCLQCLHRI